MRLGVLTLVATGVVFLPAVANAGPDVQACLSASEKGQKARSAGRLREAHEHFLVCGAEGCPALVKNDCVNWNADLLRSMPSVVFGARDKAGRDLFDVTVSMDGEVLVKKLDGKAVSVDPGPHTFRFEHAGFGPITEKVLVKEGERARVFNVTFDTAAASTGPTGDSSAKGKPEQPGGGHTVFPLLVMGAGVVAAAVGIALFATTPSRPSNCSKETKKCTRLEGQTDDQFREDQERAGTADTQPGLGIAVAAGGGALIVGGLVWYLLESPSKKTGARVMPWTTGQSSGVSVGGTF